MIIGLDVGGTHIDGVIIKDKNILKTIKEPVNHQQLDSSILSVLNTLIKDIKSEDIKQINLSTTISTNAIVENKTNKVGLIIQSGPGLNITNYKNNYNKFISGYTDHRGIVVKNYSNDEIVNSVNYFKDEQIDYVGVITKFSTRNPLTEQKIKEKINNNFKHISLSHSLSGKLNFPRRITTTLLNASVYQIFNDFSSKVIASLNKKNITAPVYILKADGGIIPLNKAINSPVETILSGPAASLMGFLALFDIDNDAVLIDIGGTTTDIFILADGISLFEPLGATINNNKTLIRAIYSKSVGLGGDSKIEVIDNKLKIGPTREGLPYSLGGPYPTLTDAFIYLEKLNIGSKQRANEAISSLSKKLNLTNKDMSYKIINDFTKRLKDEVNNVLLEINQKPVYTIKELLENKQITPKSINVIGGPAKLLKTSINKEFNLKTNYPNNYHIANAIGAALSKTTAEINLHIDTSKNSISIPELGIKDTVRSNITLDEAAILSYKYLDKLTSNTINQNEYEVINKESFNMIDGFYTKGKNIRITSQVKPGFIYQLKGDNNE